MPRYRVLYRKDGATKDTFLSSEHPDLTALLLSLRARGVPPEEELQHLYVHQVDSTGIPVEVHCYERKKDMPEQQQLLIAAQPKKLKARLKLPKLSGSRIICHQYVAYEFHA